MGTASTEAAQSSAAARAREVFGTVGGDGLRGIGGVDGISGIGGSLGVGVRAFSWRCGASG
ncbi:hypothetical protein ACGFLS_08045 [Streptomyces abikoensis]|uniref:hypothetical protein n=1 Tax=Streptomyces abikoensis TaxID=97398 RepID=UPI00371B8954